MKYIVVLCDGMADEPMDELGGKTPLEIAYTPTLDMLSPVSELGMVRTVPKGMSPGSDIANLSVMGYDPKQYYTGRSPLEALSIGVDMNPGDISFRCNLVTLSEDEKCYEDKRLLDHSSDEIDTKSAEVLLQTLKEQFQMDTYELYSGTSYRHLLVWKNGQEIDLTAPHDILTKRIGDFLPQNSELRTMMEKSYEILSNHPLNLKRKEEGLKPANSMWFWGAGTKPELPSFEAKYQKKGVMISAVDLLKGIALGVGLRNLLVEGATGSLYTNYQGKAKAALNALLRENADFAYIHVEAPDEMGHQGSVKNKIKAMENIDQYIIGTVVDGMYQAGEDFKLLVLPDHPTPVNIRTHTADPVPYLIYDSRQDLEGKKGYNEVTAKETGRVVEEGYTLISHLFEEE